MVNRACDENPKTVSSLLSMIFQTTPYEVTPRRAAVREAIPAPEISDGARAKTGKSRAARTKSLSQPIFEYVVLAQLKRRRSVPTQKRDLIDGLPAKLDFGNEAAITTRLNKMRNDEEAGYVTWDKGKKQTAIVMTTRGEERLAELVGSSVRALTPEARRFLASKDAWFGEPL
jgi:hypothetical protein